jgi:transposase
VAVLVVAMVGTAGYFETRTAPAGFGVAEQIATPTAQGQYKVHEQGMCEVVTDKGYHSGPRLATMREMGAELNWKGKAAQQVAVYANQRRVEGERGKRLLRWRGEYLERPFAHQYETGALRRVHVRGRGNVAKRGCCKQPRSISR